MAFQGSGDRACHAAVNQAYNQSAIKMYYDLEQKQLEIQGLGIYNNIPLNKPLGAMSVLGYYIYRKDFKIPLTNGVNLEYTNFNSYTCNMKWSW